MPLPPAPNSLENLPDGSGWVPMGEVRYGQARDVQEQPKVAQWSRWIPWLRHSPRRADARPKFLDLPPRDEHQD